MMIQVLSIEEGLTPGPPTTMPSSKKREDHLLKQWHSRRIRKKSSYSENKMRITLIMRITQLGVPSTITPPFKNKELPSREALP